MPELPEVETIKKRLKSILPGKKFKQTKVLQDKSFQGKSQDLTGQKITDVTRRAKLLQIHLGNSLSLLTHLKMTGQLIYKDEERRLGGGHPTADWTHDLPGKHTRIHYLFDDGSELFFNDMRMFGWMKLLDEAATKKEFSKLGPDITDPTLTSEYLWQAFQRRSVPVKQVLMDSTVVGGIGNIYACDALNLAKIDPLRPAKSLSKTEVARLFEASKQVIEKGIELNGTTFDGKYVDIDGMAGSYQDHVLAYGREGEPCYNCGAPIYKIKLGGRGTYYCQSCQK